MAVVKNMIVRVGADISGLVSGFNKSGKSMDSFTKQASNALRSVTLNQANLKKAMAQGGKNAAIVSLVDQIRELEEEQKALKAAGFSWGYEGFEQNEALLRSLKAELNDYIRTQERAGEAAEETARKTSRIGTAAAAAGGWLKKAGAWIMNLGARSKSSSGNMEGLVRSIRRIGIVSVGLRLTRAVFGELGSVVRQYISENAALQAQVTALKSSLGQALAPAINLVTNALSALMPYVVGVSNAIGSLLQALGGGWATVAAEANGAAKAISGAGGTQKEFSRTLQGFDEITKLSSKSSGGGGSGSSSESAAAVEGKLPSWMVGLTDRIKTAIENDDWFGVGAAIADSLNKGIDGQNGADVSIGGRIAGWINNGVSAAVGFVQTMDWGQLGSSIRTNVQDLVSGIDWNSVLTGLGAIGGAAARWIVDGLSNIGASIKDYFAGYISDAQATYDIGNDIGLGIITGIWDAFVSTASWVKEKILNPLVDGFKSTFKIHSPSTHPEITGIGKNIMLGVLNGLLAPLKDTAGWIRDNVLTPLSEGFKSVFGGGIGGLFSGGSGSSVEVDAQVNFTTWKDKLRNKVIDAQSRFTSWKDNLKNKVVDFQSQLTTWKDSLRGKVVTFQSNLTTWKDSLTNKAVSFQSNLTTWKDSLSNKVLTFGASVQKGWSGKLEDVLGISTLKTRLEVEAPDIKVTWTTSTAPTGSGSVETPNFSVEFNAEGRIFDRATLMGLAGNKFQVAGEAGREALLPLDRNTWWMDKIANRVALRVMGAGQSGEQNITVNLVVDGKILASTVVRHVNAQARATGKNPLAACM